MRSKDWRCRASHSEEVALAGSHRLPSTLAAAPVFLRRLLSQSPKQLFIVSVPVVVVMYFYVHAEGFLMQVFQLLGALVRVYVLKKFTDWQHSCTELGVDGMNNAIPGMAGRPQEPLSPVTSSSHSWQLPVTSPSNIPLAAADDVLYGPRDGVVSIDRFVHMIGVLADFILPNFPMQSACMRGKAYA